MTKNKSSAPQAAFFETTPLKLITLSLCTIGIYEIYWFYKMWRLANPDASKKNAIIHALLSRLFLYELLKKLQVPYAIWLAIAYFAIGFALQLPSFWGFVISYLTIVPLVYVQVQLNKRLKKPVKTSFTKRSIIAAAGGLLLTAALIFAATLSSANAEQSAANTQPAPHHKTAQTTTKDQTANTATTQPVTTDSTTPAPAENTSTTKATAPAATAPAAKKSATTPTTYPSADPAKIKQYAYTPTYPNEPQATSVTVSLLDQSCSSYSSGFHYDIHFMGQAKAGTLEGHWEIVSGYADAPSMGLGPYNLPAGGVVEMYDNVYTSTFMIAGRASYSARLHITSPNSIYSNVITTPNCM